MKYLAFFPILFAASVSAQTTAPVISSWILNQTSATGYNNLPSNVQRVQYSDSNVYISCSCIPGYDIGPWPGNPNTPKNQNFEFKITRDPQPNMGTKTATPLGHVGIWSNGVSIFNAKDAHSYNNAGVWNQNAIVVEGSSFDECLGHPAPNGEYHHHLNPVCLYNDKDSTHHSPIIGYAFDGYPIYGAYGFANTNGTGGIRRMRSSYAMRNITNRTTLPNGTSLAANQYGPAISAQYPLGYYIEDFEYTVGSGDLDEHNGRFCITPEYPHGIYAYFVTIDSTGTAGYPYTVGPTYYGVVTTSDVGPGSGHVTPGEPVLLYDPTATVGSVSDSTVLSVYPNPATNYLVIDYTSTNDYIERVDIFDEHGALVFASAASGPTMLVPVSNLVTSNYFAVAFTSSGKKQVARFVKQ